MERITEVTRDCFDVLLQLRRLPDDAIPAQGALHQRLRGFLDTLFQRAAQAGFSREEANDIAYAVVALADEIAMGRSEEMRQLWAGQSLQLHYFQENVAGEAFFTRLQKLRRDPRSREIVQVYYLALLFGFQGRYQVRGGELELLTLIEELQRELERGHKFDAELLSPRGERPEEAKGIGRRGGPLLVGALAALGLVLLLYVGLRISVGVSAGGVVQRIEAANLR